MKKILIYIFLLWVLLSDIFFTRLHLPSIFRSWDIALELVLIAIFFFKYITNEKIINNFEKPYMWLLLIISTGLVGDIIFNYYHSFNAVFRDIATFLKFPLVFIILKNLQIDNKISEHIDEKFILLLKIIVLIIAFFGIVNLFFDINMSIGKRYGIRSYMFLFSHQTFLVITMVFILTLFEYKKDKIKNLLFYEIIISLITLGTMRTKAIMFLGVFWVLRLFWKLIEKHKKKAIAIILVLVGILATHKIITYMGYASSTREVLYKGCITLLVMCFPFGSGFATFASHISGAYRSKVYEFIDLSYVWKTNYTAQLGDVGFPYYIGQFGFVGCIFIVLLAREIVKIALKDVKDKIPVLLIFAYILIGLTSESTLLNYGVEIAIILAIVSTKHKENIEVYEINEDDLAVKAIPKNVSTKSKKHQVKNKKKYNNNNRSHTKGNNINNLKLKTNTGNIRRYKVKGKKNMKHK